MTTIGTKFKNLRIYFGAKAIKKNGQYISDASQRKDIAKEWHVQYQIRMSDGSWSTRIKVKGGINYYKTVEERYIEALSLKKAIIELLENGFNPVEHIDAGITTFSKGLDLAMNTIKKRVSVESLAIHNYTIDSVKAYSKKMQTKFGAPLSDIDVKSVSRAMIKSLLDKMQEERKFKNGRRTSIKNLIHNCFNVLIDDEILDFNPITKMRSISDGPSEKHAPYTAEEKLRIRAYTEESHPHMWLFLMFIYHAKIRKAELCRLKISSIDMNQKVVWMSARDSKNKKKRFAIISPELERCIVKANIIACPGDWFIFSKDMKPGETPIFPYATNKWWTTHIKKNLGINKTIYAMKHTGGDDMLDKGIGLGDIKETMGHSSEAMTRIYTTREQLATFDRIRDQMPDY